MSETTPVRPDVLVHPSPAESTPAYSPKPADLHVKTRAEYAGLNDEAQARLRAAQEHAANVLRTANEDVADTLRTTAIQDRIFGKEGETSDVSLLNDRAEMLIYGSKGRTYHHPETNEVIADKEHVIPSVFERIRDDKRWGEKEAEREAVAKAYETELNQLLDDGFELTQAKIIMDHRMGDYLNIKETGEKLDKTAPTRVRKLLGGGVPAKDEAERQAKRAEAQEHIEAENKRQAARMHKTADKADAELQQLMREKGIFSEEDLARVRAGEELYDGPTYKRAGEATPPPKTPEEIAREERANRADLALTRARDRYAKAEAARSRRAVTLGGDRSREGVDRAYTMYRQALSESLTLRLEDAREAGVEMTEAEVKANLLMEIAADGKRVAEMRASEQQVALGSHDREGARRNLNTYQRAKMKLRYLWYNMNPQSYRTEIEADIDNAAQTAANDGDLSHKQAEAMIDRLVHNQVEYQTEHEVRNNRIRRGSMLGVAALTSSAVGTAFADTISHGVHGIFGGNKNSAANLADPHHGHYQPNEKHELGYPKHGHYQPEAGGTNGVTPEHVKLGNAEFPSQYFDQHDLNLDATVRKAQEDGLGINRVGLPGGRYFLELVKPNGDKVTDSTQRVVDALQPYVVKK